MTQPAEPGGISRQKGNHDDKIVEVYSEEVS
jgi:hypothetical protein